MQTVKITLEFNPADLTPQNGIQVPAVITLTETQGESLPPPNPLMERLRQEFEKIVPLLSEKSQAILCFMLETADGLATYDELANNAWQPDDCPTTSCVRVAVHRLRWSLIKHNASYVIFGSRAGVYSFAPTPAKADSM